jgi:opacity protein-like surface antigen
MNTRLVTTALALVSLPAFAGSSAPAIDSTAVTAPESSPWEFRVALYGWAEGIEGDVGVLGRTAPVDISFSDIIEDLDMGFMGAFEVGRDRWSFIADFVYADIGAKETIRAFTVDFSQEQFLGNFTVNYELFNNDAVTIGLYAGARVNALDIDLSISGPFGFNPNRSTSESWVDPIIGARFGAALSEKFICFASGDVGGFGVSSEFTWQALAGFGYRVTENGTIALGYRAIGTDYTNGGFTYDVTASGPVLGYEYKF